MSGLYSVPVCPWCRMPSRSKPEHHNEWETVRMECGSEIYPPRATSPSIQSKACKVIADLRIPADKAVVDRERLERLESVAKECAHWLVQQYAGANAECYFCGSVKGVHDGDCFSLKAESALRAQAKEGGEG